VVSLRPNNTRSCVDYCGYHTHVGDVYYAVIPYATCSGCAFPGDFFDTLTEVSSHELAEAVTNPAGNAWWDPTADGDEIGDLCNRQTVRLGGYQGQTEWSNAQSACAFQRQRMVLFYSAVTQAGAVALIDAGGVLQEQHEIAAGSFGVWTHIIA